MHRRIGCHDDGFARHAAGGEQLVQRRSRTLPCIRALREKRVQRRLRKRAFEQSRIAERCQIDDRIFIGDAGPRTAIGRGKNYVREMLYLPNSGASSIVAI
jgi:hypothetical protein